MVAVISSFVFRSYRQHSVSWHCVSSLCCAFTLHLHTKNPPCNPCLQPMSGVHVLAHSISILKIEGNIWYERGLPICPHQYWCLFFFSSNGTMVQQRVTALNECLWLGPIVFGKLDFCLGGGGGSGSPLAGSPPPKRATVT